MNRETISIVKFVIFVILAGMFGSKLLDVYSEQVRNQAVNDCYTQSYYRVQYMENGKQISTSETQKYIYDQCLLDKNIR